MEASDKAKGLVSELQNCAESFGEVMNYEGPGVAEIMFSAQEARATLLSYIATLEAKQ